MQHRLMLQNIVIKLLVDSRDIEYGSIGAKIRLSVQRPIQHILRKLYNTINVKF